MKDTVAEKVHVKAAGGINNLAECVAMIEAGSDRIGISKTKAAMPSDENVKEAKDWVDYNIK